MLEVQITNLHTPTTTAKVVTSVTQMGDARVTIPYLEAMTAEVTLGMGTQEMREITEFFGKEKIVFKAMLRIYYNKKLQFWGPIIDEDADAEKGTVNYSAYDPSIRLKHHFVRRGDEALGSGRDWGYIPIDYRGLRMLRDCGLNTPDQTARGVPDLGILNGNNTNTPAPYDPANGISNADYVMKVERGEEVWGQWVELVGHDPSVEFFLRPVDNVSGAYCYLDTYDRIGTDRRDSGLQFECNMGGHTLKDFKTVAGFPFVTHTHVLDDDGSHRVTVADAASSAARGIYVQWEATRYKVTAGGTDVLQQKGEDIVGMYGEPLEQFELFLMPEPISSENIRIPVYDEDFFFGDTIAAHLKKGYFERDFVGRVVGVELKQRDQAGATDTSITVVEERTSIFDPEEG